MIEYDIVDILPHNPPMILIDRVVDYNIEEKWLISQVVIDEKGVFFDKELDGISSVVGIEYMAQTIGCYAFFSNGCKPPKIGFLLGSRLYNTGIDVFKNGEVYSVKVNEIFTDEQIVAFDCIIFDNDEEEVASATVNVYQSDDAERFFTQNG